jgi:tRNA pseudouridine38-40 synthase
MARMKAILAYDGTAYYGWQVQGHYPTIQASVEEALQMISRNLVRVTGAGRTDSGVHAYRQVAHFDWDHPLPPDKLIYGLNGILAREIRILSLEETAPDFHARFDAKSKSYIYRIDAAAVQNPFTYRYSLHYRFPLDKDLLLQSAKFVEGEHDFSAFQASGTDVVSTRRKIFSVEMFSDHDLLESTLTIRITATGFLRKMVRFLVGTMLEIASWKRPLEHMERALNSGDRNFVGIPAPARGLFLEKVNY